MNSKYEKEGWNADQQKEKKRKENEHIIAVELDSSPEPSDSQIHILLHYPGLLPTLSRLSIDAC